jgi:ubiquinone/menaquinone biosynthesis C-methylase UbiE
MYQLFAAVYDAIYSFKNYAKEAEKLTALIRTSNPKARTLLDVACGTGGHLQFFKDSFVCSGVDLGEDLLNVAREKLPDVNLALGDMRTFDLAKSFDAVTCLFSAIGYMPTVDDLNRAISNMGRHLALGGVMIVEPWIDRSQFLFGHYDLMTAETETMKIARANTSWLEGEACVMDFHFLVADKEGVKHFSETHRLGFFSREQYYSAFEVAGLKVSFEENGLIGRGLYVATK